jgi:hypothetical protein
LRYQGSNISSTIGSQVKLSASHGTSNDPHLLVAESIPRAIGWLVRFELKNPLTTSEIEL